MLQSRDIDQRLSREREHFNRLAEETGEIWWGTQAGTKRLQRRGRLVANACRIFSDPFVLELGCCTGAFSRVVLEQLPALRLIGCDISPKAIAVATRRCHQYLGARFEVADCTSLPYQEATFDAVIGSSILHHLPLEVALHECLRVLKPDGILWFAEPNMMNPQIAIQKNIPFIKKLLKDTPDETAFFRWGLKSALATVGFADVSVTPFDFLHPAIPGFMARSVEVAGGVLERIPVIREVAGSLLIRASKC